MDSSLAPEEFCRLCLNQNPPYFSIFENQAHSMFESLTSIKISLDDSFPNILCLQCLAELKNAYTVQQKFIQTQKYWQERLQITKPLRETCKIKQEKRQEFLPIAIKREVECESGSSEVKCEPESGSGGPECEHKLSDLACMEPAVDLLECDRTVPNIPEKSRDKYKKAYHEFVKYCEEKQCSVSESVMLKYFSEKTALGVKVSSLWTCYSMLKATLNIYKGLDVSKYFKVLGFLKQNSKGYKPRKSQIFTKNQIDMFLRHAPDEKFLMIKVVLIFGIAGSCSREELCQLLLDNVKDLGSSLIVRVRESKTRVPRIFSVVDNKERSPSFLELYRKYVSLRPPVTQHRRFFVAYRQGRCTKQPVGINVFGKLPSKIAAFLKLPNPQDYTGHCFKRSSVCLLKAANRGGLGDVMFHNLA